MPYVDKVVTGNEAVRSFIEGERHILKLDKMPQTSLTKAAEADKIEVVCSSFTDPGDDWSRLDFYLGDEKIVSHRIDGY